MENHDCDNDQLPINPELLWDLWLQLDPYKSVEPGGSHPKILKDLVGVLQSSQEGQPCPGGHGQPCPGGHGQPGKGGIVLLCSEMGQPHFQCWGQFWVPQCKKDIKLSEIIQRRATKMAKVLEGKLFKEWLRSFGLFSLEKRLRTDLIVVFSILTGGRGGKGTDLFALKTNDKT
ncbi:hypothetical protein TURU_099579 [Turdus rufiventris]|nr:hypothetical protein TURU_099579 [Turdus rufiventris]